MVMNPHPTANGIQVTIGTIGGQPTIGGLESGKTVMHGTVADAEELMEVQMETGRKSRQITGVGKKDITKKIGCKGNGFTTVRPR